MSPCGPPSVGLERFWSELDPYWTRRGEDRQVGAFSPLPHPLIHSSAFKEEQSNPSHFQCVVPNCAHLDPGVNPVSRGAGSGPPGLTGGHFLLPSSDSFI